MGNKSVVHIFTDGACSPNPGLGGWGAILVAPGFANYRKELSGAEPETTNNRMELMGAIEGLKALTRACEVTVTTDSMYLCNAFRKGWLAGWQKNGWRTKSREPVKNADLWKQLIELTKQHEVSWVWVKGHSDHEENNNADRLAVEAREKLRKRLR